MMSLQKLHAYAVQSTACRPAVLLQYFGEALERPCQVCDICLAGTQERVWHDVTSEVVESLAAAASGFEQSKAWGHSKCKKRNAAAHASVPVSGIAAGAVGASEPLNQPSESGATQRSHLFWRGWHSHSQSSTLHRSALRTLRFTPRLQDWLATSLPSDSCFLRRHPPSLINSGCPMRQVAT